MTTRRLAIGGTAAAAMLVALGQVEALAGEGKSMAGKAKPTYGVVGQIKAQPGKRDELQRFLSEGSGEMPGNLAYIIGADLADPDSLWITELWVDKAAHAASLSLPGVQAAIAKARPIIAGFGVRAEFLPG